MKAQETLNRKIVYFLGGGILAFLAYELYNCRRIRFRTLELDLEGEAGDGDSDRLSILHISDIHATARTGRRLAALEALSHKQWDLVFITGDLIENDSGIEPLATVLGRLRARYGKYAVLGNHDYLYCKPKNIVQYFQVLFGSTHNRYSNSCCVENDIPRLVRTFEGHGVRVLGNELAEGVTSQGRPFQIFGIDDFLTGRDDPAALYSRKKDEALRLVLMHSPCRLEDIRPLDPALVLCGHTHGGQVRVPFFGALSTGSDASRRAASGMVELGGCRLHISSGVGAGAVFPWRIYAPPEITEIIIPVLSGKTGWKREIN
ncbi:MAG: metallophosphoesterase [Gemmatimonadota bacterium]|nr:metallophosphoesterase [Gemmatimonadota bacterium]